MTAAPPSSPSSPPSPPPSSGQSSGHKAPPTGPPRLAMSAKEAFLVYDQLAAMRGNARHICDLPGIVAFIEEFNAKTEEVRRVVSGDPAVLSTLDFLRPIDADVSGSEYPSAIINGKRGRFMVSSGLLMNALKNFMRLYLEDDDRTRLGADKIFRDENAYPEES